MNPTGVDAYSRWDGTQDPDPFTPDDLFDALSETLLADGDPWEAVRRALESGLDLERGQRLEGLQDLLRQLAALRSGLEDGAELRAELDALESELRAALARHSLDAVDRERAGHVLGEGALRSLDRLASLVGALERAGYLRREGDGLRLTTRGVRRIGQRALADVFAQLREGLRGPHRSRRAGVGGEGLDETRAYVFGDPFLLDVQRTIMNALRRAGSGAPVPLGPADFEVFRTEHTTRCATVLLLDTSRSMLLRGCFVAAKKVAIALETLIRGHFPNDTLYVVGFADRARELSREDLPYLDYRDVAYGTNLQDGLIVARGLLARHAAANRQIVLITDGEPTAFWEDDKVHFAYPPTFQTLRATLREVGKCTRANVMINTFMLERSQYLVDFVNQMHRINKGRAFFSDPDRLGEYVLVDYLANRRKRIA